MTLGGNDQSANPIADIYTLKHSNSPAEFG
jgi:hypothetical protein